MRQCLSTRFLLFQRCRLLQSYAQAPPPPADMLTVSKSASGANGEHGAADKLPTFTTDTFDCFKGPDGCQTCLVAFFLPCLAHGVIADAASGGRGQTAPCALYFLSSVISSMSGVLMIPQCVLGTLARSKFRKKYNIGGSQCNGARHCPR
jgi:Cys-rich protein (TIGR01571 family)